MEITEWSSQSNTHHPLLPEVDSHGGNESGVEHIVRILVEEAGLANSRVPNQQELEQVVIVDGIDHDSRLFCRERRSYSFAHFNGILVIYPSLNSSITHFNHFQ